MYTGKLEDVEKIKAEIEKGVDKTKEHLGYMRTEVLPHILSNRDKVITQYAQFPLHGFKDDVVYNFEPLGWCLELLAKEESDFPKRVDYGVKSNVAHNLFEEGVGLRNRFGMPLPKPSEEALVSIKTLLAKTDLYITQVESFLEDL